MIAWHGTGKVFDRFESKYIGTGEGSAMRGIGFNFSLDRAVAEHYARRAAGHNQYVYKVHIPDLETLLPLDESVYEHLIFKLHETLGFDADAVFEEAQEHDEISFSFPDSRAQEAFSRVLIDARDDDAWDELEEWSPGYDWASVKAKLYEHSIEFDLDAETNKSLYDAALERLGPEKTIRFLREAGYYGTYSPEPESVDMEQAISVVIFDEDDIKILDCFELEEELDCSMDGP